MNSFSALAIVSVATLGLSAACGSEAPEPKTPEPPAPTATAPTPAPVANQDVESNPATIQISEDIRNACGIGNADAHFAFDEAMVRTKDTVVLEKLVECFSTGALKGRQMRLVGHTDNRGDEEYNYVLGERRANAIQTYLTGAGLSATQATSTSRGELNATGTDEVGWAEDRRVDIVLAQ
jgi:peptidoglycan-associated lipoprotein